MSGTSEAVNVRLARAIARRRTAAGLSQAGLARRAGVTGAYVSMIEAGKKRAPSLAVVARIAEVLGATVGDLVDGAVRRRGGGHSNRSLPSQIGRAHV